MAQKGRLSVGVSGGYINSNTFFTRNQFQKTISINSVSPGLMIQHMSSKYAGLQISFQLARKGIYISDSSYLYRRDIDYLEIPILTHFEIGKKKLKLIINLGPQIGFAYQSAESFSVPIDSIKRKGIVKLAAKDNATGVFQFGVVGGLAFSYQISNFILQLEGRYYNSFTNVIAPGVYTNFNNQTIGGYFSVLYNIPLKEKIPVEGKKVSE
ncbi:MAG: porin family protein [Cytophagales bacterium]